MRKYSAGILLLSFCTLVHAQFSSTRDVDYPRGGVMLGNGWMTLTAAKTAGACVDFSEAVDLSEDHLLDLSRVVDKEQLNRALDVSVEFEAKAISGAGGSAKATYAKSIELKNESLNLVISARVRQGARYVTAKQGTSGVQLAESALKLLNKGMNEFTAVCGDTFVSAIYGGGEVNAFLEFTVASSDEREAIGAAIKASGISYSGSATVNQTMKRYRESSKLRILTHTAGGTGVPIAVDEAGLMNLIKNLPADSKTAPHNYTISITRYDQLINWPGGSLPASRFAEMDKLVAQYQRFDILYLNMFDMINNPANYAYIGTFDPAIVAKAQDDLRNRVLPALRSRLDQCLVNGSCALPDAGTSLDYDIRAALPVLKDSFAAYGELQQLQTARDNAATALANTPPQLRLLGLTPPNPAYSSAQQRLNDANQKLTNAANAYPAALSDAMFKQWVEIPSHHRCVENGTWEYCLTQATLANYRNRIVTLVNKAQAGTAL